MRKREKSIIHCKNKIYCIVKNTSIGDSVEIKLSSNFKNRVTNRREVSQNNNKKNRFNGFKLSDC